MAWGSLYIVQRGRGDGRWKDGGQKWYTTDAQVQGQAVRAIAAFVAALPPQPFPVSLLQVFVSTD